MNSEQFQIFVNWFSIVMGVLGVISFIFNIYQHFKIQSLRQAVDSMDRIAKSAKLECKALESQSSSPDMKSKYRVLNGLISSLLNVSTTFMKYDMKHFENKNSSTPFVSLD